MKVGPPANDSGGAVKLRLGSMTYIRLKDATTASILRSSAAGDKPQDRQGAGLDVPLFLQQRADEVIE